MSDTTETYEYVAERDAWGTPPGGELPPRPRRRLVTPATLVLAAVLIAALGFFAGVKVQKGQGDTAASAGAGPRSGASPGAFPGTGAGPRGGTGARPGGQGTFGTVANKKGKTLYVQTADGNTVKVRLGADAKVIRTASSNVKRIHPGDTVVVQGARGKTGTITATQVNATSATAASSGGLFPGAGGGSGPPGGGSAGNGSGGGGGPTFFVAP